MSERIELTRGPPRADDWLEYSGPSPEAAIEVLDDGEIWWGPIKVWSDDRELLLAFLRLVAAHHPDGLFAVSVTHDRRYVPPS